MHGTAVFAASIVVLAFSGLVAVTVSDDDIRAAQRELWLSLRLVVEPGGAAALAALRAGAYVPAAGERVVVVVCGANCDPATVVGNGDPERPG